MPLVERIRQKLMSDSLDTTKFEETAVALLANEYNRVSPIERGSDLGRDADIYLLDEDGQRTDIRVLVTSGNPYDNLLHSFATWTKNPDFPIEQLLLISRDPLPESARKKIRDYCANKGLPRPELFGRDWLVHRLVRNTEWRVYLLDVHGRVDALSTMPAGGAIENEVLVGRDGESTRLASCVAELRDVVLHGVPGVGKSRLLGGVDVHYVDPEQREHLANDLAEVQPRVVVLDDAHLHLDLLRAIVALRRQEGYDLAVVAICWPVDLDAVARVLVAAERIEVRQLTRPVIDTIVRGLGVTSVRARSVIQQQADGRPGWARMLCDAFLAGDGEVVVQGETARQRVVSYLERVAPTSGVLDALACVAALGSASLEELEQIASMASMPSSELVHEINRLATGGLLDRVTDYRGEHRWSLFPNLRTPFAVNWFFGTEPRRSWSSLRAALPERTADLNRTMLAAAAASPSSKAAVLAAQWRSDLPNPEYWDIETLKQVRILAESGERQARFAAAGARAVIQQHLAGSSGTASSSRFTAANSVVEYCVRAWLVDEAVHALLDLELDAERDLSTASTNQRTIIKEIARHLDPDRGHMVKVREVLLEHAGTWVQHSADPHSWLVYCHIVRVVLEPRLEDTWTDPGVHHGFTLQRGFVAAGSIGIFQQLWERARSILSADWSEVAPAGLRTLLQTADDWARVATRRLPDRDFLTTAHVQVGQELFWTIFSDLVEPATRHEGLALEAQDILDMARANGLTAPDQIVNFPLDEDLVLLIGRKKARLDRRDLLEQQRTQHGELARRLVELGPSHGAQRLRELLNFSFSEPQSDSWGVAQAIAIVTDDLEAWFAAAVAHQLPYLAQSTLAEALQRGIVPPTESVLAALGIPLYRWHILSAVVGSTRYGSLTATIIESMTEADASVVANLMHKTEPDEVLHALLVHPDQLIRAHTSLLFAVVDSFGPSLPSEWLDEWRQAFLDVDHRISESDWRLDEFLTGLAGSQPDLCADWFARRFAEAQKTSWSADDEQLAAMRALPVDHRERLARQILGANIWDPEPLRYLAGHDPDMLRRLLEDGTIRGEEATMFLAGEKKVGTQVIVPTLLQWGVTPQAIAAAMTVTNSWSGSRSEHVRDQIAWFEELAHDDPKYVPVTEAAIARLTKELEAALAEEYTEQVRGGW